MCCLAGTIVQAARKLDVLERAAANAEGRDLGCRELTPRVARAAWRNAYGEAEADRLGFYEDEWLGERKGVYRSFNDISVDQVIAHIEGAPTPYDHDGNPSDEV